MARVAPRISLSSAQRADLERLLNSPTAEQRKVFRAQVLLSDERIQDKDIAQILSIVTGFAHPRSSPRRTMADMRNIATANGTFRVDTGAYAAALANLAPTYMQVTPTNDAWANAFTYAGGATYTLTSLGADGAAGPAPPSPWVNDPYTPDLVVQNGQFTQAPTGQ